MGYGNCCESYAVDDFKRDLAHLRALREHMSAEDYGRIMARVVDAHFPD